MTLEKIGTGYEITKIHLSVAADVPEASAEAFQTISNKTKSECPVSKLVNAVITLDAKLS